MERTVSPGVVASVLQLRSEESAGVLVSLTQVVDVDNHFFSGILPLFKTAAHVQSIVRTSLNAQSTEHASVNGYIEQLQLVLVTLGGGCLAGGGHNLDDTQRAVLGAGGTAGAAFFVPDKFLTPKPRVLFDPFLRVLDGERLLSEVLEGHHQTLGQVYSVHINLPPRERG